MRAGICTQIWRNVEIIDDVEWMRKYNIRGIVIGRRVMFSQPMAKVPAWLFRHELQHAYQIIEHGTFMFYLKYFLYSLRYGYRGNPFEVEAREKQKEPLTLYEEELLWKLTGD